MNIASEIMNGAVVLSLAGHLNPDAEDGIQQILQDFMDKGQSRIILNLKNVTSVNSLGLSVLIAARKRAKAEGGDLKLAGLQRYVKELFLLTRLHNVFDIYEFNEDALASF